MALVDRHLARERLDERVRQRAAPSLDALRLIAIAKDLEAVTRIGLKVNNKVKGRLFVGVAPVLDGISNPHKIDYPFFHSFSTLSQILVETDLIEPVRFWGEVLILVVDAFEVRRELSGKGFEERNELLVRVMFTAEDVEVDTFIDTFQLLAFEPEFPRQVNQILMVGIDQLAAEFAEH